MEHKEQSTNTDSTEPNPNEIKPWVKELLKIIAIVLIGS